MAAAPTSAPPPAARRGIRIPRRWIPYLLLAPGLLWLGMFFLAPLYFMARQSLEHGTLFTGYQFSWEFSNYTNAIKDFHEQLIRSFEYAAASTILALLIGYPLAYAIATRGGRWRTCAR